MNDEPRPSDALDTPILAGPPQDDLRFVVSARGLGLGPTPPQTPVGEKTV